VPEWGTHRKEWADAHAPLRSAYWDC